MANKKFSDLTELAVDPADDDIICITDTSAGQSKYLTWDNLEAFITPDAIDGGTAGTPVTIITVRADTEANRTSATYAQDELFYATDTFKLYVGDGSTAGGKALVTSTPGINDSADATAITITSGELVGIGTASPSTALDVNGTVTALAYAGNGSGLTGIGSGTGNITNIGSTTLTDDNDNSGAGSVAFQIHTTIGAELKNNGDFHIDEASTGFMYDKNTGNIGIGTNSPLTDIHVKQSDSGVTAPDTNADELMVENSANAGITIASGISHFGLIYFADSGSNNAGGLKYNHANDSLTFRVGGIEPVVIDSGGGVIVGSPTGGSKGAGTLNAVSVYDDNALLTCYVFDQAVDGTILDSKWDAKVPDRKVIDSIAVDAVLPVKAVDAVLDKDGNVITPAIKAVQGVKAKAEVSHIEERIHTDMRRFKARIGTDSDPLDIDKYANHWKTHKHLTSMPNEEKYDPIDGAMATGSWVQRLIETVEIQAVLIEQLNQRLKSLES